MLDFENVSVGETSSLLVNISENIPYLSPSSPITFNERPQVPPDVSFSEVPESRKCPACQSTSHLRSNSKKCPMYRNSEGYSHQVFILCFHH